VNVLEAKSVSVIRQDRYIIKNLSLTIPEGQTTVIIGRTGSGKSTLLKTLGGLVSYDKGELLYRGVDINAMEEKTYQKMEAETGFMFQDSALWANRSLYDNLTLPIIVDRPNVSKAELNELVFTAMESMNFKLSPELRPSSISAGERKIISFLRAVIADPPVIFLDDPTTAIDRRSFKNLGIYIEKFKEQKKTLVIVTENPYYAKVLSDRLVLIRQGEILLSGSYAELSTSEIPAVKKFFEDF
jgi:phospholipid/cholesterol/gamma-HCH transport system ATP-binding protein